jgi:hypothetical protein
LELDDAAVAAAGLPVPLGPMVGNLFGIPLVFLFFKGKSMENHPAAFLERMGKI